MKSLLYYLLQVIVASGILYGYYHLALRNKKFHRYNRFYLLAATFISITIPFLNIPVYFSQSETDSSFVLQTLTVISSGGGESPTVITAPEIQATWFSWQNLSFLFYILIASLVLIRIIFSLIKIRRIIKNNPVEQLDKIHFVNTSEPGTPFSFFRWLFWNKKIELQSEKGEQIFRHELFHIKQKHSWDIMYLELLTVLLWINPFFHLIKKEVKAIHEFLADQFAVTDNKKWEYAELLLMQVLNTKQQLVNPFFHNQIKRRIAMITASKKPSYQYLRKVMVLPIAAIVMGLFAFSYKTRLNNQIKPEKKNTPLHLAPHSKSDTLPDKFSKKSFFYSYPDKLILEADTLIYFPEASKVKIDLKKSLIIVNERIVKNDFLKTKTIISDEIIFYSDGDAEATKKFGKEAEHGVVIFKNAKIIDIPSTEYYKEELNPGEKNQPSTDNIVFDKVEIEPSFPGGDAKWKQYLKAVLNQNIPDQKGATVGTYTVIVQFIVKTDSFLTNIKALTNHGFGMEEEAVRLISKGPRWIPALQNGKQVNAIRKQPVTFVVEGNDKTSQINNSMLNEVVVAGYLKDKGRYVNLPKNATASSFVGGETEWRKHLERNINPMVPIDNEAPTNTYTTVTQFLVKADGSTSEFKSLTNHGYGMEEEALRVIQSAKKWEPLIVNGEKVNSYKKQPVTFVVTEQASKLITEAQSQKTGNGTPQIPEISLDKLRKATPLQLLQLPEGTKIVGYKFTIDLPNDDIVAVANTGKEFNSATKNLMLTTTAGRLITFDLITIIENGKEKKIPSKVYAVTN